jgi:hypothetical protein
MNKSDSASLMAMVGESATFQDCRPPGAPVGGTITSEESLREHLQWAIELEHSTIPPYLCALYSIEIGRNPDVVEVISSVVVEEMLHMTLAANLLNAVGGRPQLDTRHMLPGYPRPLPIAIARSRFLYSVSALRRSTLSSKSSNHHHRAVHRRATTTRRSASSMTQSSEASVSLAQPSAKLIYFLAIPSDRSPTSASTLAAGALSPSRTLPPHSLRWKKLSNKGRGQIMLKFGMGTATCSIPNVIRSRTITASRSSNSAGDIAGETPHDQGPPAIRFRLIGRLSGPWGPIRESPIMRRAVRSALLRKSLTIVVARFCNVSRKRSTAPLKCLGQPSERCIPSRPWPRD